MLDDVDSSVLRIYTFPMEVIFAPINIFFITFIFLPFSVKAMTISAEKRQETISIGNTVYLDFYLNSDDQEINAIDGEIDISGDIKIKNLSTAKSVFEFWPTRPSFEKDKIKFEKLIIYYSNRKSHRLRISGQGLPYVCVI